MEKIDLACVFMQFTLLISDKNAAAYDYFSIHKIQNYRKASKDERIPDVSEPPS